MKAEATTAIRVAVTGGPGVGKTALLERLRALGYQVVPEVARRIIADRKARGQSPRPAPAEFARMIVDRDIEQYRATEDQSGIVLFDRSLIDSLGMLAEVNRLSDADRQRLLAQYPYHPTALVLPPWREIYRMDAERDQTFDQAVRVDRSVRAWYTRCGYGLVEVPRGSLDERCAFVIDALAGAR